MANFVAQGREGEVQAIVGAIESFRTKRLHGATIWDFEREPLAASILSLVLYRRGCARARHTAWNNIPP